MDIALDVASASVDYKLSQVQEQYSLSMAKKVMDQEEIAAKEIFTMMPEMPQIPPKGDFIDVYA